MHIGMHMIYGMAGREDNVTMDMMIINLKKRNKRKKHGSRMRLFCLGK